MDLISMLILTAIVILVYKFFIWNISYVRKLVALRKAKGLPIIPYIGNAHQLKRRHEFLKQICMLSRTYNTEPFYVLWIGPHPLIIFHRADYLDILLSGSKNQDKSFEYKFLEPWLGTGLLTSKGQKWSIRRRLITPTFHFDILSDFMLVMNEQSDILVENLKEFAKNGKEVDMFRRIALCALDIICESAMGQNVNAQNDMDSAYVKAIATISEAIFTRFTNPFVWFDSIFSLTKEGAEHSKALKILHNFTKKVIKERSDDFEQANVSTQKRIAFLDMLLKAKAEDPTISFEDIQEEVDTFMFEGHDTTAVAASWACQLIGSHPDVQKKLHEELDSIFQGSSRPITNSDFGKMKYLECVIKETLRLFPSVPFYARTITETENVAGFEISKGSTAIILAIMVHRDEKYFPNPEKFDPDRFLPEKSVDRHAFSFIPFSAGRRNCIGQRFALMEEKIVLANLLRNFEIKSTQTVEELKPVAELILRPLRGIPITLKLRS